MAVASCAAHVYIHIRHRVGSPLKSIFMLDPHAKEAAHRLGGPSAIYPASDNIPLVNTLRRLAFSANLPTMHEAGLT